MPTVRSEGNLPVLQENHCKTKPTARLTCLKQEVMKWVCVCLMLMSNAASGQFYFYNDKYFDQSFILEAGVHAGAVNCLTDLGKAGAGRSFFRAIDFHSFRQEVGLFAVARWNDRFGLRMQFNYGALTAADSILQGATGKAKNRYQRNLHFRTNVFEVSSEALIWPLAILWPARRHILSPLLGAGIGVFHFNPKAMLMGEWIALPPLRTEGTGPESFYSTWQLQFPVTAGIRYEPSAVFACYLEYEHRFLRTDYLDDVSRNFIDPGAATGTPESIEQLQALYRLSSVRAGPSISHPGAIRGNPARNDSFFSVRVGVALVLNRQKIR